jgi:hypothetical protein
MKKFRLLLLMAVSAATIFTSCKDTTITDPTPTKPVVIPVKEYTAVIILPPLAGNDSKTFYGITNGKLYSINDGKIGANSDSIDLGYYYSSSFGATFVSPSDYAKIGTFGTEMALWTKKNLTTFKSISQTSTLANYQSIARNGQIDTLYNTGTLTPVVGGTGTAGQRIGNLAAGQVFVVNNANNLKAIFYVESILTGSGSTSSITVRVKVQGK